MPTFLHQSFVYGPVMSRRLGVSLGLNLSPTTGKFCTFNCIYCECGLNEEHRPTTPLPTAAQVEAELREVLQQMATQGTKPDSITMAGNGEPTANPSFPEIVDATLRLRDEFAPGAKVSVLTNATLLGKPEVRAALERVDDCIAKVDTVDPAYVALVDQPNQPGYDVRQVVETLADMRGHISVQTMFLAGTYQGKDLDNTGEAYVQPWLAALERIRPAAVTIYTIERDTPVPTLQKAAPEALDAIAAQVKALGIPVSVSY